MSGLGKFEGEPDYVEAYWTRPEEADLDLGRIIAFELVAEDAKRFADLAPFVGSWLVMEESDQGFVTHAIMTKAEVDALEEEVSREEG